MLPQDAIRPCLTLESTGVWQAQTPSNYYYYYYYHYYYYYYYYYCGVTKVPAPNSTAMS